MKVTCELYDYSDRGNAYDSPRLIVQNNQVCHDEVYLIYGDTKILVNAEELKRAIENCSGYEL